MAGRGSTRPFCLLSFSPHKGNGDTCRTYTSQGDTGYKGFQTKKSHSASIGFQLIEMDKKSLLRMKINLSQTKNHSAEIDFSFG